MPGKIQHSKLPVRLIALDLDDTLLTAKRTVDPETIKALSLCAQKGIYIVLCSGRPEAGIMPIAKLLNLTESEYGRYIIAINGCSIFDIHTNKQVFSQKLSTEILVYCAKKAREYNLYSQVYKPDLIINHQNTDWTMIDPTLTKVRAYVPEDFLEYLRTEGSTKMLIPGEPETLKKICADIKAHFGAEVSAYTSKPFFLEIMPKDCGKGESILKLAELLKLPSDSTMCFGDGMNDESMIRLCKYGVAMQNACPELKKIAAFVTEKDNNNSGIAQFLYEYVL